MHQVVVGNLGGEGLLEWVGRWDLGEHKEEGLWFVWLWFVCFFLVVWLGKREGGGLGGRGSGRKGGKGKKRNLDRGLLVDQVQDILVGRNIEEGEAGGGQFASHVVVGVVVQE